MKHRSEGATALLGMPQFVVGAQIEVDGEIWLHVETTAEVVGCSACGTRAAGHGRRRVAVRDLPIAGRDVVESSGGGATAWRLPDHPEPAGVVRFLSEDERDHLSQLVGAVVVADDASNILYFSAPAEELLGWTARELVGRRLTTIIPPEFREAHLAGFARYQLSGEGQLVGRPIRLPALRSDDSIMDMTIVIEPTVLGGRRLFHATLDVPKDEAGPADDQGASSG